MAKMSTYERAIQIYQILVAAAHNRQVLTYPILGKMIGVPAQGLANHLDHLMRYCQRTGLPPLTVLVVQTDSGRPGKGLTTTTIEELHRDRERVFAHDWYRMKPLAIADLQPIGRLRETRDSQQRIGRPAHHTGGRDVRRYTNLTWERIDGTYDLRMISGDINMGYLKSLLENVTMDRPDYGYPFSGMASRYLSEWLYSAEGLLCHGSG